MEERFIRLESKMADQDRIIEELNSVIVQQQHQIDTIEEKVRLLLAQMEIGDPLAGTRHRTEPTSY